MFNQRRPEFVGSADGSGFIYNSLLVDKVLAADVPGAIGLIILDGTRNPVQHYEIGGDYISREELIHDIAADPLLTHGLYGNFEGKDSNLYGYRSSEMDVWKDGTFSTRVAEKFHRNFLGSRQPLINTNGTPLTSFEATITEGVIDDPHAVSHAKRISLALSYMDIGTRSHPNGTRTQYTVMLPGDSVYVDYLRVDQTLMIDLMRAVFPDADRSDGTLRFT